MNYIVRVTEADAAEAIMKRALDGGFFHLVYYPATGTTRTERDNVPYDYIPSHTENERTSNLVPQENAAKAAERRNRLRKTVMELTGRGLNRREITAIVGGSVTYIRRIQCEIEKEMRAAELAAAPPMEPVAVMPTLADIVTIVCQICGVRRLDLFSPRRAQKFCRARHVAYWLARKHTDKSFPVIAHYIGERDYSTVIHGVKVVEKYYPRYAADIAACEVRLAEVKG